MAKQHKILLVITGSIAAYKALEFIRLCRKAGHSVVPVMTESAKQFVTPMSVASLAESPVYDSLFSLKDETEMGHIRLSREAEVVLVAPATADIIAKMSHGIADDLASTLLLATDKQVMIAPAMNVQMYHHKAVQRNLRQIVDDGALVIEPQEGELACGEYGAGRMAEPQDLLAEVIAWVER